MIYLTENIVVDADRLNYIVGKPKNEKDKHGKDYVRIIHPTYHGTLAEAVKWAVGIAMRSKVSDGTITELRDFIVWYERISADFEKRLAPLES